MKLIVRLALLCALTSTASAADTSRVRQEDDIHEAVLRYQFKDYQLQHEHEKTASCYCVSIGETEPTDPSDNFLRRFNYYSPSVRRASACDDRDGGVVEKHTANAAVIFNIGSITWVSDSAVTVEGSYVEGNVGAVGYLYRVNREKRKWKVESAEMRWISQIGKGPGLAKLRVADSNWTYVSIVLKEGLIK
ncbi:MAG TPA: hypothetical protein VGU90_11290 [Terriglobales bacterium]|nr:hypothetical protein [Terriglobales bacterium]